jgi:hypothetical protein
MIHWKKKPSPIPQTKCLYHRNILMIVTELSAYSDQLSPNIYCFCKEELFLYSTITQYSLMCTVLVELRESVNTIWKC